MLWHFQTDYVQTLTHTKLGHCFYPFLRTCCGRFACDCESLSAATSSMSFSLFASGFALAGTRALSWEGFFCLHSVLLCSFFSELDCCSAAVIPVVPATPNRHTRHWRHVKLVMECTYTYTQVGHLHSKLVVYWGYFSPTCNNHCLLCRR